MPRLPSSLLFSGLPARCDGFLTGISTVALLRTPARTILFDTGPYAYRPILQGRLRKAGVDPASIDTIVLSHIHWDTIANADLFPNADVVVHGRELANADHIEPGNLLIPVYASRALRRLKLRPVDGECLIVEGIKLVELFGHTPGSIGLLFERTLLAGDAVSCAGEAAGREPHEPPHDPEQALVSLSKALRLADVIYPGHDRPFRPGPPVAYIDDYALRLRFFTDPSGQDEELRIGSFEPRSFASWPND